MTTNPEQPVPLPTRREDPSPLDLKADRFARVRDRLRTQAARLRAAADQIPATVIVSPRGGLISVAKAEQNAEEIADRIGADEDEDSLRHRRVRPWAKFGVFLFVLLDIPLNLWFTTGVFNVDPDNIIGIPLAASLGFTLLTTVVAVFALHKIGHAAGDYKDDERHLRWRDLRLGTRLSLFGVVALVIMLAGIMVVRVYIEGTAAGSDLLAVLFAITIGSLMLVTNSLVFWTAFLDGSIERDDLDHYTRLIKPQRERHDALRLKAQALDDDQENWRLRAERDHLRGHHSRLRNPGLT